MSLQASPQFRPGTRISSIRRRGSRWVVDLLEPKSKVAGPPPAFADDGADDGPEAPPSDTEESEGPPGLPIEDDEDSDDSEEGPPSPEGESGPPKPKGEKGKGGKEGVEEAILHTLTQILHALQGGGPEGMGGPDVLGPGPGSPAAPPPPKAGPKPPGGPGEGGPMGGAGAKLRPGETRNTPGVVPVGAPSFSNTRTANPLGPAPVAGGGVPAAGAGPVGPGAVGGGTCPQCGYPEPCPLHGGGAAQAMSPMAAPVAAVTAQVQKLAGRSRHISLKAPGDLKVADAVKVAKQAVQPFGYQVEKAKRVNGSILILASAV